MNVISSPHTIRIYNLHSHTLVRIFLRCTNTYICTSITCTSGIRRRDIITYTIRTDKLHQRTLATCTQHTKSTTDPPTRRLVEEEHVMFASISTTLINFYYISLRELVYFGSILSYPLLARSSFALSLSSICHTHAIPTYTNMYLIWHIRHAIVIRSQTQAVVSTSP